VVDLFRQSNISFQNNVLLKYIRMRKIIVLSVFLCTYSAFVYSQNLYPIKFDDCDPSKFFLEGEELYVQYDDEKLLHDLIDEIDQKTLNKVKGEIYFQVFIDTLGNHCCVSIKNELNTQGKKLPFKEYMNKNTRWDIPFIEGEKSSVSAMVKLSFEIDKIVLSRLGFNGKTGWIELSNYIMKRA
jgi:hypothetical protein